MPRQLGFRRFKSLLTKVVGAAAIVVFAGACVEKFISQVSDYDSSPLVIQTVSLFNQKMLSKLSKISWNGDWIFRRGRLDVVDGILRNVKPDILVIQEGMERRGSKSESDREILAAGALEDYDWTDAVVDEHADTQEQELLAVAVSPKLKLVRNQDVTLNDSWKIGSDGAMTIAVVGAGVEKIAIFDVQMPQNTGEEYKWYSFVELLVSERIKKIGVCPKRVVVAGFLPSDQNSKLLNDFMTNLQLRDASLGFCQVANRCHTSTSINELFMITVGDETPTQSDRILLHQSAYVYSSSRNFDEPNPNPGYGKQFGLSRMWPTQRFGWVASARFAKCSDGDG